MALSVVDGKHLVIGPANYAGQAFRWAEAVKDHLRVPALSFATGETVLPTRGSGRYRFPVHRRLPHHRVSTPWGKRLRMHGILRHASHAAIDGFLPVYHRLDRSDVGKEFDRLVRKGLGVALIAHGSDIRDPDLHMSRYAFSYYADAPDDWVAPLRHRSRHNRTVAASLDAPLFVSTPDLLIDAPAATWLPLCVELERWHAPRPALDTRVPTVLHLPSRRNPPIKGTAVVDPILRELDSRGWIRYLAPSAVDHASVTRLVTSADVVVEQILGGSYGTAAVEGLAAGRLVIGFVGDDVRARMPEAPPIVDAPPPQFRAVLESLLDQRELYAERAASGPAYARRWHDGRASATALMPFLQRPSEKELALP